MSIKPSIPDALTDWARHHGFDNDNINSRIENAMSPLMLAAISTTRTSMAPPV